MNALQLKAVLICLNYQHCPNQPHPPTKCMILTFNLGHPTTYHNAPCTSKSKTNHSKPTNLSTQRGNQSNPRKHQPQDNNPKYWNKEEVDITTTKVSSKTKIKRMKADRKSEQQVEKRGKKKIKINRRTIKKTLSGTEKKSV